jgi:hypothetical protein
VFVCVLLGSGGLLLCSGGVFFGVRSGGNDIFDIYYCCYAVGAFSLGSVLGLLLGNDIYSLGSVLGLLLGNQTGSGAHPASDSLSTGALSRGV